MDPINASASSVRPAPASRGADVAPPASPTAAYRAHPMEHERLNARHVPVSSEPSGPPRRTQLPNRGAAVTAAGSDSRETTAPSGWRRTIDRIFQSDHHLTQVGRIAVTASAQAAGIEMADLEAALPNDAANATHAVVLAPTARERVLAVLDDMPLHNDTAEQQEMAGIYREWAGETAAVQEAAGVGNYSIKLGDAALPAGYDFARQMLSSMARSPATNAMATAIGPRSGLNGAGQSVNVGELSNQYDPALAGGTLGGLTAHMVDTTLLSAMDRRAAIANFPQFKAIDPKVLVPDPCPVQLRVVDGKKMFWRPVTAGALDGNLDQPTMNELKAQVTLRRKSIASLQSGLDGKQWGVLAQPVVTAGFNVVRRHVMPIHAFTNPALVFAHSLWASGLGGGVTKLTLGMGKSVAYTHLDDLVGGTQQYKANVFAKSVPHPEMPAASLSDISGLGSYGLEVAKETLELTQHFWTGPWRTSRSWLPSGDDVRARLSDVGRAVGSNVMASVGATGIGSLVGQLGRGGSNSALQGESLRSLGYSLQQAGQSSSNDFVWQASKEYLGGTAHNLSDSLDAWRANKRLRLQNEALSLQAEAAREAADLKAEISTGSDDEALYLSTALDVLVGLRSRRVPEAHDLEIAQKLLSEGATAGAVSEQPGIAQIQALIDKAQRALAHDAHLARWTKPKSE